MGGSRGGARPAANPPSGGAGGSWSRVGPELLVTEPGLPYPKLAEQLLNPSLLGIDLEPDGGDTKRKPRM